MVSSHLVYRLDIRKTSYILLVLLPLTITSIYRLVESVSWGRNPLIWTKSAFWILQITFELCVGSVISTACSALGVLT